MSDWHKRIALAGGLAFLILGSAGAILFLGGPPGGSNDGDLLISRNPEGSGDPGGVWGPSGGGGAAGGGRGAGTQHPASSVQGEDGDIQDGGGASGPVSAREARRAARRARESAGESSGERGGAESGRGDRRGDRKLRPGDIPDEVITDKLLEKAIRQNSAPLAEALEKALGKEDKGPLTGLLIANLTEKGTKFTEEEIPLLMDALKGESNHEVQSLLLKHLERIDSPDEKLEGYLSYLRESPTPTHAAEVVEQLALSKSPQAVDGLVNILDEGELSRGRRQIMDALGRMGDPAAVDSLSRILQNPDSRGDQAASLKALAAIGDKTALGAILGHAAQENNRYALQAIQEIDTRKHPDAVPVLGDALLERSYPAYQLAILRKLSRDGDQRVERSVQRAMDKMENRQVIAAAADSLSRFGSEKSMIYLEEKMMQTADPYTKKTLERAIRRISARIEKERGRR